MTTINYDKLKYEVLKYNNYHKQFWMINPISAVTELLLGQRFPKVVLFEKYNEKSIFVPRPHCGKLNDARIWAKLERCKNWFGCYCPDCGGIIPCLMNYITFLILVVTFPLWIWFKKPLRHIWLKAQPERFRNINLEQIKYFIFDSNWIIIALRWGAFMLLFMTLDFIYIEGRAFHWDKFLRHDVPVCSSSGTGYLEYWVNLSTKIFKPRFKLFHVLLVDGFSPLPVGDLTK